MAPALQHFISGRIVNIGSLCVLICLSEDAEACVYTFELCVYVLLLQSGQLSDLDLRALSIAFNTIPLNRCAKCTH